MGQGRAGAKFGAVLRQGRTGAEPAAKSLGPWAEPSPTGSEPGWGPGGGERGRRPAGDRAGPGRGPPRPLASPTFPGGLRAGVLRVGGSPCPRVWPGAGRRSPEDSGSGRVVTVGRESQPGRVSGRWRAGCGRAVGLQPRPQGRGRTRGGGRWWHGLGHQGVREQSRHGSTGRTRSMQGVALSG